ncbi:hypothetical protein ES288_A12G304900v1 [Gossypium darwinii]|uniref:non-specific serine/threonine protein kinase n=1 Tax=Gossypium darwinii TaxID=34276 RepID=A0A5D2EFE7_GOSDA|nr:hypothetical protein ES288_A12G304900v1 [Gossypium darwinii]
MSNLLCFSLFLFSILSAATSRSINETETQALLAIKARILIDPYEVFVSWNGSRHFCDWPGVTCGRRHRRVTALRLPSLNLVGDLSPCIANLTFLKVINVGNNSFRGPIPLEVTQLHRLEELVLANNSFHGELPRHLARCSNLKFVNLNGNALGGEIHAELGSLSKLRMLQLAMNNFIGTIPPSIGNISSLQYLSLMQNQLEGRIPIELGHLSNLRFLQLASNKFSGTVPKELYNISSIFSFGLADNQLQGQVPPYISLSLPNLRFIYLGKNKFSGPIPTSIANATGLIQLDMGSNELSGPIPNLGSLQNLQALNFGDNFLDSSNDLSFLSSLTNCTNLSLLWLYKNNLTGVLPDSIGNLSTNLNQFRIETNFISGAIPKGIGNLAGLEYLGLFENMFTSTIPDSIGKMSKLKYLYAYTNRITGEIPLSLGNMTQLIVLSIEDNLLQGNIPVTMGNFIHLEQLDLSQNRLNATIPKEVFGLCSSIIAVSFASNGLTGTLPSEVGNCKNLILLDVSNNNLYGEIPSSLENCLMLELLSLQGNSFNGTIPSSFKRLRSIQVLDLSNNDFSGRIPMFLAEVPLVTDLNLSFNMFEGEVPMSGVFGNISAFSVIGNKKLCGGIKPLRLPVCPRETETKGKNFPHKVIIATSVILFVVLFSICLFVIKQRANWSRKKEGIASPLDKKHPKLSYAELLHATDGFSSANLIGKGRYGSVYKGTLTSDCQKPIAVKVLDLQQRGADRTFKSECQVLKNLKHRNLVKVITSCSSIDFQGNDFKALVFEFMPNGSLETWLHPSSTELNHSTRLNLTHRLNIAIDVALALDYLHSQFGNPVVHCDLKPSNVLLDGDLTAYVSDFGLTQFLTMTAEFSIGEQSSSIGIRGTMGYIPPEYGMGKEISTFGDVYSYGVVLMELFTGKRPTDSMFTGELSLRDYVKAALPDRAAEIADPWLNFENEAFDQNGQSSGGGTGNTGKWLGSVLGIGVACSADSPIERMIIGDVLSELHKVRNSLIGDHRRRRA